MADTATAYTELFDYDAPGGPNFVCSTCNRLVGEQPCPDHAPTQVSGLRLVDCDANPPHLIFVHDRDDYGADCFQCRLNDYYEKEQQERQCRHWGWRAWRITDRAASLAYQLGIIGSSGNTYGDGHNGCVNGVRFRGPRPYVLGVSRDVWRCWFRGHRRGEPVGLGMCGKCVPWPCCKAITEEHAAGCPDGNPPIGWSNAVPPGGVVCFVPDEARPDGVCGMPVESEPCSEHTPKRGAL